MRQMENENLINNSTSNLEPGHNQLVDQIVTVDKVKKVLEKTIGKKGIGPGEIDHLANYLMNFFGYGEYVIDNVLSSEDRDVFYMLEEEGFLTTTQEEVHLKKGKLWRIHYWILKKDQILRLSRREEVVPQKKDDNSAIYDEISEEQWSGRK
jgi:hypothetical protein